MSTAISFPVPQPVPPLPVQQRYVFIPSNNAGVPNAAAVISASVSPLGQTIALPSPDTDSGDVSSGLQQATLITNNGPNDILAMPGSPYPVGGTPVQIGSMSMDGVYAIRAGQSILYSSADWAGVNVARMQSRGGGANVTVTRGQLQTIWVTGPIAAASAAPTSSDYLPDGTW
jgi:hypothetical protein